MARSGLPVRTGVRAPAPIDSPGIGSQADQFARLDHVVERHGLLILPCPDCSGRDGGCARCDDAFGMVYAMSGSWAPCGPECPLLQLKPA